MPEELRLISVKEKQELLEMLHHFGIKKLDFMLFNSGKEKIRAYTGNLTLEQIKKLHKEIRIELIGFYLLHVYHNEIRLSFDAIALFKDQITKNILEIDDKQAQEFLKGRDLVLSKEEFEKAKQEGTGFKVLSFNKDFLGIGKLTQEGRIVNYMPKERRLR